MKSVKRKLSSLKKTIDRKIKKLPIKEGYQQFFLANWLLILIFLFLGIFLYFFIFKDLPLPTRLGSEAFPASTSIFDRNGHLLYEIYIEKNRVPVELEVLPDYVKQATIAIEDKNFYQHRGFAFEGILRAVTKIVFKHKLQGGSTITQQLVKTALLTPERTIRRKIREALLAMITEIIYSKDQILEMYLNQVPYGGTAYGIEAASQTYFNKHAKDLSLAEMTLLAGLPAAPTRYSPFGAHPEVTKNRQKLVLGRMVEDGYITEEERKATEEEELEYAPATVGIKAPHFVLYVKELLVEEYGEQLVEQGGLKVTTTLDLEIQDFAQEVVATEVADLEERKLNIHNGAALVTNPQTGEILAMIGSHDYFDEEYDGKVNVTLSRRQPGSSIKPINYALGLMKGVITPATVINDVPTCFSVPGQKLYCPVNYDGQFHGPVQARFDLGNSYNLPAVKVLALNGLEDFVATASAMGITTFEDPSNYGLSITLGGGEVRMIDMATAFSAFANLGIRQNVYAIEKVEDRHGKTLYQKKEQEGERVLPMEVAYLISHILLDNNARSAAFGASSYLNIKDHPEVSVKTGTTNDKRDNWTIGYNPSKLVAVWVGNNDNTPMSYVASGITGASPIWNQIMTYALKDMEQEWPMKPEGVVGANVCALSGKMPNPDSPCETRFEYFIEGMVPSETENLKTFIEIDKTTGQMANEKTPPENRELQEHQVIYDPLGAPYCLDCIPPTEAMIISPYLPLPSQTSPSPQP
ncbi:MAG TPA: PBP1A family penicillin-binding protein [Patescibacteria group bacterium]|nr:PBP1A family penicillin-binding protein [Patescibacteria group bacterium]